MGLTNIKIICILYSKQNRDKIQTYLERLKKSCFTKPKIGVKIFDRKLHFKDRWTP